MSSRSLLLLRRVLRPGGRDGLIATADTHLSDLEAMNVFFWAAGLSSHEFLRRTHLTFRPPPPSTG
jgi:hypothetical protein